MKYSSYKHKQILDLKTTAKLEMTQSKNPTKLWPLEAESKQDLLFFSRGPFVVEILLFRSSFALLTISYHNIYSSTKSFYTTDYLCSKMAVFHHLFSKRKKWLNWSPFFDLSLPTKLWWLAHQITNTKLMKSYLSPSCRKWIVQKTSARNTH